jgi:hypothetical protein
VAPAAPCSVKIHPDRFPGYRGKLKAGEMSFDLATRGLLGFVGVVRAKPRAKPSLEGMAGTDRNR